MPTGPAGAAATPPGGLEEAEATRRRAAGLGNDRAQPGAGRTYLRILVENTVAPINSFLFATCLVLVWLGLPIDAGVTAIPVLLNVLASVALETRAKRQLDRLAIIARPVATVIRAGREMQVAPDALVLGDLLVVARGDQVILDGEIQDGVVELDESLLTGEADPVRRGRGETVLSGSTCLSGRAVCRVTKVGGGSYANRLVERARQAKTDRTPLQRDVARLVGASAILVLVAGAAVAVGFWGVGRLLSRESVQAAAVLVAIVPQGLAIIVTLMYAAGALSISRAGALVQRINAVESMSRVDTLVLDKTGTLTSAGLVLRQVVQLWGEEDDARRALAALAGETAFTDRTTLALRGWLTGRVPDAGERADGERNGLGARAAAAPGEPGGGSVPFASDRRWSGVAGAAGRGALVLGAPEVLAERMTAPNGLLERAEAWAADGQRVLLLAEGPPGAPLRDGTGDPALPHGLVPLAMLAFGEEVRPDAAATLAALANAGVRLKVASGDHRQTVAAIARQVGIDGGEAVDGAELTGLDDAALADRAETGTVFGRVEPALKARIILALRGRGHYVAMVGDGVNDIIALKEANLGLAMQSGSPAARAAADVVLLGDAFSVLPPTVVAGQRIVEGMRLVTCLLFTRTVYALLVVLGAAALSSEFPMTPRTNSVLALLTVGIPTLVLAAWAPEGRSRAGLVTSAIRFSVPAGIAVAALALPVYAAYAGGAGGIGVARTALTAVSVWCGILLIPFLIPPGSGRDARPTLLAGAMAATFGVVLAVPGLRELFELAPLPLRDLAALAAVSLLWAVVLFRLRAMRVVARLLRFVRLAQAHSARP